MSLRNRKQFNGRQVIGRALRQGYSGDNGVTAMSGNPQPYPSLYLPEGSISVEDDNVDQLNFGDCASYAAAKTRGDALLFKGNDFERTDIASAG
jgi:hypothetical protein